MINSKLIFTPEQFYTRNFIQLILNNIPAIECKDAAQQAQAIHDAWLEAQPVVYGNLNKNLQGNWCEDIESTFIKNNSTHRARLVDITEIKKEPEICPTCKKHL